MPRPLAQILLAVSIVCLAGCAHTTPGARLAVPSPSALPRSASSHIVVMLMENEEASAVLGDSSAPYINTLAHSYGVAAQSFAITHPSLPNYLALTSGSTHGITSDCTDCTVKATNIVDQLETAGISWKAYLEGMPSSCYRGGGSGGYAKKHNPFIYYDDVASSPRRCARLVGFPNLAADLRAGRLPTYAWISPNLCDDGHDCGVSGSERFLKGVVPSLLAELGPHGFLIITWDEGSSDRACCANGAHGGRIATIVLGPDVRHGSNESEPVDHYGVLATIEEALGLPLLVGAADGSSGRLNGLFQHTSKIR